MPCMQCICANLGRRMDGRAGGQIARLMKGQGDDVLFVLISAVKNPYLSG